MHILFHDRSRTDLDMFIQNPVHAVGLHGDDGAGKGYAATYLAENLLHHDAERLGRYPYLLRLDASETSAGIESVRNMQSFLNLRVPGHDKIRRVLIIEHIDSLGHEAQNALLKTLEEPPADSVIIVTYAHSSHVLPTITSRVQSAEIRPVAIQPALDYFEGKYDHKAVTRAFYISGGYAGLLTSLLEGKNVHPLLQAIDQARDILKMSRYERLSAVDTIVKNKQVPVEQLLNGMYRLLEAAYRQSVVTQPRNQLKPMVARLELVQSAIEDRAQNVQAKLVLSRLFSEL